MSQIRRFVGNIDVGDLVIIPSVNSRYLSFGRITGDVYEEEVPASDIAEGGCPYRKRRPVAWFKTVKRTDLDPNLYRLFYSQHVVTDANDYAAYIDRTLHSFFRKGDEFHLVIEVTERGAARGRTLPDYMRALLDIVGAFNAEMNENLPEDDVQFKVNVQSPGFIEVVGPLVILLIAVTAHAFSGGDIAWKLSLKEFSGSIKTPGLLDKILAFRDAAAQPRSDEVEQLRKQVVELTQKLGAVYPPELRGDATPPLERGSSDD